MLRNPECDVPTPEIVWALEAISGRVLGTAAEAWTAWLGEHAARSPTPR